MTDDLVKRLRKADEYEPLGHDGWAAADRIEALRAALTAARDAALEEAAKAAEKYTECCQSCAGVGIHLRALKGKRHE